MLLSAPCGLLDLLRRLGQCHQAREREVRAQLVERGHSHTLSWRMVGSAPRRELFAGRMGWRTGPPAAVFGGGGCVWGADGDVDAQREPRACCSTQQLMVGFVQAALSAPLSSSVLQWWRGSHRQSSYHFMQLLGGLLLCCFCFSRGVGSVLMATLHHLRAELTCSSCCVHCSASFPLCCRRLNKIRPRRRLLPCPCDDFGTASAEPDPNPPHHAADVPEPSAASWLQLHQSAVLHRGTGAPQHLPVRARRVPCEFP